MFQRTPVQWETTQGEDRPWWRADPPHSAPHSSLTAPAAPDASGRTPGRAGAREGNAPAAQPQPHSAVGCAVTGRDGREASAFFSPAAQQDGQAAGDVQDVPGGEFAPPEFGELVAAAAVRLAVFTPPDVWTQDRPSLAKGWAYASRGEWTGQGGTPRRAGQAYAIAVMPFRFVLAWLDWILERPSRLVVVGLLLALLGLLPLT